MDLLGGYGSDGSGDESGSEEAKPSAPKQAKTSKPPAGGTAAATSDGTNGKRKVVNFAKLPVSRPLLLDGGGAKDEDEAPLRKAAEAENLRLNAGRSLLSALPAPKVTLGSDTGSDAALRLDLSEVKAARAAAKQAAAAPDILQSVGGIMRGEGGREVRESNEVPQELRNHPMFSNGGAATLPGDRPSALDLHRMKDMKFLKIGSDDMKDPDWYMTNEINGGPGLQKKLKEEVSMYETKTWEKTTHANPSGVQKRKHQINWLAHEAMEKEAEMLDRAASSRLTKAQTSLKYGW